MSTSNQQSNNFGPYGVTIGIAYEPNGDAATAGNPPPASNESLGVTSTENFLANELRPESGQQGVPSLSVPPTIAGCESVAWANWNSGSVGSQGSKFS
jgi:hypothetical protein